RLVQGIESVKVLFLCAFVLRQELDIIHQQHIYSAELVAEAGHLVIAQRVNHLVDELLAGDVANGRLRQPTLDLMSNGLHQVGFAHTYPAIEKERVIGFRWTFRYGLASCMGKLIPAADHKCVERVPWIELR